MSEEEVQYGTAVPKNKKFPDLPRVWKCGCRLFNGRSATWKDCPRCGYLRPKELDDE